MSTMAWYRLVKPHSGRCIENIQLLSIYRSIGLQIQWILRPLQNLFLARLVLMRIYFPLAAATLLVCSQPMPL